MSKESKQQHPKRADQPGAPLRPAALAAALMQEIAAGLHPVAARFPTEAELQARFGVGRHTVREALKMLTEQGLVGRRRKTGSVVLSKSPLGHYVHSLRNLRGLLDFAQDTVLEIQHEGFLASAGQVWLEEGSWFRIAGLRRTRADREPLCWSEIFVPQHFAPDQLAIRRGDAPIYQVTMDQHGLRLDYVEQEVKAAKLPASLCRLLRAKSGSAALLVRRRYVSHTGTTFEISENLYPADRYSVRSVIRQRD